MEILASNPTVIIVISELNEFSIYALYDRIHTNTSKFRLKHIALSYNMINKFCVWMRELDDFEFF